MHKKEYLSILKKELRHIPKADKEKALEYYDEYFTEAGIENESCVIDELGEPRSVAKHLITELALKRMAEPTDTVKKGLSNIWLIVLAIFAAPIGLPIALTAGALLIVIFILLAVLLLCILLAGMIMIFTGFCSLVAGCYLLFSQPLNAIAIIGFALYAGGIGLFISALNTKLIKYTCKGISGILKKILGREKN